MRRSRWPIPILLAGVAGLSWGCFVGEGTLGAICLDDSQCGTDQRCRDSVCGQCGDNVVQPGELCLGDSSEESVFGEVSDLESFQPSDDFPPRIGAVANGDCPNDPDNPCWGLFLLELDEEGNGGLETMAPLGVDEPGTVPQIAQGSFDGEDTRDVALAVIPPGDVPDISFIAVLHNFPFEGSSFDIDVSLIAETLHAADLNGDGLDDLIAGGRVAGLMSVNFAEPGVGFAAEQLIVTDPGPRLAPPADMDGDGDLDLIIASAADATVGVNLNDGSGSFTPLGRVALDEQLTPSAVETADFDGDGNLDVAVFAPSRTTGGPGNLMYLTTPSVVVLYGDGAGGLTLGASLAAGESPVSGLATDINNDGAIDIVVADAGEDKLPVFLNRGGEFPDQINIDVAAGPQTLLLEDFDGDGVDDIVVGNANGVVAVVPTEN
ncbi:FG-GAP repeat domain-containing protein [Plesiocystis pacifica]|uniref:FG-GAP repeat domain-containing protein n=1 Tax=Plesiocystis pacifica TaxID=191768 RepID=UPI0012F8793A|nr:VCBS repeat-containing protein [Plesiocystis pacifica]